MVMHSTYDEGLVKSTTSLIGRNVRQGVKAKLLKRIAFPHIYEEFGFHLGSLASLNSGVNAKGNGWSCRDGGLNSVPLFIHNEPVRLALLSWLYFWAATGVVLRMKRQRSYSDDLMEADGSGNSKEWGRREQEGTKMRSLKGLDSTATTCYKKSYSSRGFNYEKDEARGSSRKRMEETEGFERPRDGYARVSSRRDSNPRRTEAPRSSRESGGGYRDGGDSGKGRLERGRRSSSFSVGSASKRESYENLKFGAKGFRSERERPKRDDLRSYGMEGSGSLWKRTSEDYYHRRGNGNGNGTGNETSGEDRSNGWSHGIGLSKSPQGSKETVDSFKESRKGEGAISQSNSNSTSEMEEGELEPELEPEPESRVWQHHEQEHEQQTGQLKPDTEGEGEAEAEAEADAEAGAEQHQEELSSKGIQEEHGDISAAEADEGMATQMDDSKHTDGKVDKKRDVLFGDGSLDGDRKEVGKGEELKPVLDLDKTNEGGENNDLEISPRVNLCSDSVARDLDSAGKNVTVDEVVQELNQKETEQQPTAGWGIEERRGVDLEVEVKMETMEDASDEIEKAEEKSKRKELTFSFMCDTPRPLGDVQDKIDAGSRGDRTLKSINSLLPQEGEDLGKDKDQRLSLSLSNGPGVYGKWDERALLLSNERKKKAPLEEDLGVGGSSRFQREPQSSTKIEAGRSELSNEKQKQKKAKLEPLQLSLGLPDVSLTLASPSINVAPASPSRGRSYQSLSHTAHTIHTAHTQTGSDAFTTSISFSGSHPFVHNPSCSLTQNSMENYEFSVGSHPAFQANSDQVSHGNWNANYPNEQSSYDNNGLVGVASQDVLKQRREASLYQRILQNGNLPATQFSQGMFGGNSKGQPSKDRDPTTYERGATDTNFQGNFAMTQGRHGRSSEGSLGRSNSVERHAKFLMAQGKQARSSDGNLGRLNGPEKHAIFPRELPEQWREVKSSPTQSVGSREKGSDQWKQIIRDSNKSDRERASMPQRGYTGRGIEHSIPGAVPSIERVLFDIVSEPIPVMSQKLKEMPAKILDHLRQCSGELIGKNEKAEEFFSLQKILQNRTDLTSEVLLQAHKVQLEILVAVKTGIKGFILNNNLPSSELVEVFLQLDWL
ncbi:hypothetical protein SUGI_0404710 [Cryptomeria japonica]|nr:hypothetical protein SUGI_0404710 [Cryptomeria japonica]